MDLFDKFQSMYGTILLSSHFTCWANLFWFLSATVYQALCFFNKSQMR